MSDETTENSEPIRRTVKVAGVETKSGGADSERPWTKYTLVDENDKKQATFDKKVGLFVSSMIGKYVEITIEKSGKYWNLTAAKPADGPGPTPKSGANGTGNGGYTPEDIKRFDDKDFRIARESALKSVCQLYEGSGTEFGSILVLADKAVEWIYSPRKTAPQGVAADSPLRELVGSHGVAPIPPEIEQAFREASGSPANEIPAQQVTTRVVDIRYKDTRNGGKRFTVSTSGDETYYTFSETIAKTLKSAKDQKAQVTLVFSETEFGKEIGEVADVKTGTIQGQPVTVPS